MANVIKVRDQDDGDFIVIKGGEVYVTWEGQPHPSAALAGFRVSAAEICDWQQYGAIVESVA